MQTILLNLSIQNSNSAIQLNNIEGANSPADLNSKLFLNPVDKINTEFYKHGDGSFKEKAKNVFLTFEIGNFCYTPLSPTITGTLDLSEISEICCVRIEYGLKPSNDPPLPLHVLYMYKAVQAIIRHFHMFSDMSKHNQDMLETYL